MIGRVVNYLRWIVCDGQEAADGLDGSSLVVVVVAASIAHS